MTTNHDITILRELAQRYAEIAALPVQEEKRKLWADHNSLKPTRVPIIAAFGMWNVWCREVFGDANMKCEDPFYKWFERHFRMALFQHDVGDDSIQEPWVPIGVPLKGLENGLWGVDDSLFKPKDWDGFAGRYNPPVKTWDDVAKLVQVRHETDEEAGNRNLDKLASAIGDILPIDVQRAPAHIFGDVSTSLAKLRGLEEIMVDMYESPRELHQFLAFLRDGILANHQQAEDAGHFTLTCARNHQPAYAHDLEPMKPNSGPRKRKDIWGVCAAQEYTLVSPAFHDAFMYQYQIPICEKFGLVHYGCCEDLTEKITMLRQLKNLRSIGVAPLANVRRCAEQIQRDYVLSWRPNPTDMVCCGYNEERVEKIIRKGVDDATGCVMHINLKDIETLEGDNTRLKRWVRKVRQCVGS
ncbi:MAG: hypothetical protein FWF96_03275 [Kiritimatiellaeota bacterium]|nr:hypothetical protein [Kiritimatiellota bacterium]